jgi:hypothetical protein
VEQWQKVALVVGGAAGVDAAVADGGLERRCGPGALVAHGLHVVVAVNEDGRGVAVRGFQFAHRERVAAMSCVGLGRAAGRCHAFAHPPGGARDVGRVAAAGGDRGNPQPVGELVEDRGTHGAAD